ncbi:MAG TPA: hypothetical protein VK177_05670 [Flavobacteriales bacterium]|nr:hypothetical protein [Flavobacteriales bacterium]
MRKFRQSPLVLLIGGVAGVFILLSLSRTTPAKPSDEVDPNFAKTLSAAADDPYIAKMLLAMVYMEQKPMDGIKMFRKIVDQHPKRFEAPFQLGTMAMNTQQYNKACNWFEMASKIATDNQIKANILLNWSDAMVMDNKTDSAKLILKQVFNYSKDSLLIQSVRLRLSELEKMNENKVLENK